jgi:hypothetical protein
MVALVSRSHRRPLAFVCDARCASEMDDFIDRPYLLRNVRVGQDHGECYCSACGAPLTASW